MPILKLHNEGQCSLRCHTVISQTIQMQSTISALTNVNENKKQAQTHCREFLLMKTTSRLLHPAPRSTITSHCHCSDHKPSTIITHHIDTCSLSFAEKTISSRHHSRVCLFFAINAASATNTTQHQRCFPFWHDKARRQ